MDARILDFSWENKLHTWVKKKEKKANQKKVLHIQKDLLYTVVLLRK